MAVVLLMGLAAYLLPVILLCWWADQTNIPVGYMPRRKLYCAGVVTAVWWGFLAGAWFR